MKRPTPPHASEQDPIKAATVSALNRVLDPILELVFDAGITVQELNKILRERAVRCAAARIVAANGKESRARISIMTGLPRSEVANILNAADPTIKAPNDQHPARRILAAWHDDPRYLAATGQPDILAVYGKRRSFEHLVNRYGGGIPVRAMLDELIQLDAVETFSNQRVRAKARVPVVSGLNARSINSLGDRGRDLLETLVRNLRLSLQPMFEATAVIDDADSRMVTVVRRDLAQQGANFIDSATSLLQRSRKKATNASEETTVPTCRLGVSVFYFQDDIAITGDASPIDRRRRKNLRRQPGNKHKTDVGEHAEKS